ncbi:MAG: HAD hydrolase-like protein, partial [Rhodospirillales bacterium]|nr:HAD hydrolase-like protein [Rhodospirillales bacterium]
ERTVMIGDTTYDMKMAVRAGAIGIGVGWGYHEVVELRQTGAYLVIDHFRELPPIVSLL